MILEVPQLQVIDRLRDYSSCASDAMGLRLSLRGSGVRVHCRARWCADTSLWAAIVLSLSVVLVLVCVCARICRYGLRLCFHSPWFWCSCVCVQIRPYGPRLCFRSPWFWCSCVCVRIRRYGQGLRFRSPWLVFIAVFGYGDVGKDCALALLGLVLVFIPVVAQRQLPWFAYSADHRDCPVCRPLTKCSTSRLCKISRFLRC